MMEAPTPGLQVVGGRPLIIPVISNTDRAAVLVVAEHGEPVGRQVGTSEPAVVPAKTRVNVVFTVPDTFKWVIFVNDGALITSSDVDRCVGLLPVEIGIEPRGEIWWGGAREPWCGSQ